MTGVLVVLLFAALSAASVPLTDQMEREHRARHRRRRWR